MKIIKKAKVTLMTSLVMIGILIAVGVVSPAVSQAAPGMLPGLTGSTFTLQATEGHILMPTGQSIYMWGFTEVGGSFQYPGPNLIVNQGDVININLTNNLSTSVSMTFPGQSNVMADGNPVQPELDVVNGNLTSLTTSVVPGNTITYSFTAGEPGTYIYESGTAPSLQVQMGLFGALIVRPTMGINYAYNDARTAFTSGREYLLLLHELDPVIHDAVEDGLVPDLKNFWPRYWTINGRAFPDTIAGDNPSWLPSQPYGSLVIAEPEEVALIRLANAGVHHHPYHTHGNHLRVLAHDGQLLEGPGGEDLSREEYTLTVGAGQTYDATFTWSDIYAWDPDTNPIPVQIPDMRNLTFPGPFYSGSPYLGEKGDLPVRDVSVNEYGEFYFPWHSHSEREMANWGGEMGGMLTLLRINPPGSP